MSNQAGELPARERPEGLIEERFSGKRDVLERLADLDNRLSDDAERVLEILDASGEDQ